LLQGLLLFLVVVPVLLVNFQPSRSFSILDAAGLAVWALGFLFEALGDWQLAAFVADPANAGKLMQDGLWRYTRHPNYFGEVTQWWGLWLLALNVPYGWVTIIGPLTITVLILKVSGIPLLETKMAKHPDFSSYARKTSVFFPWIPRA
jgi:steroid 5-alpha reductase family enzyme